MMYGHGATVVMSLSSRLKNPGHTLFFDNFFTSYNLIEIMTSKQINVAGTARINRFGKPNFKTDNELKAEGRGSSDQLVSKDELICLVKWADNKSVHLASNYCGVGDEIRVKRFDKKAQKYVEISQPEVVAEYNMGMGGVDLLDQLLAYYRIFLKSRKWTLRVIFHFINMAVVCAFLEHKSDCERFSEKGMKLLDFQQALGSELTTIEKRRSVGRPNTEVSGHRKRKSDECAPQDIQRLDKVNHFPIHESQGTAGQRCKRPKCNSRSRVFCDKCKVHLCLNGQKNCFFDYHNTENLI